MAWHLVHLSLAFNSEFRGCVASAKAFSRWMLPLDERHTGASGGIFGRVFNWANAHKDEFDENLAKRNPVEATISSLKRVFARGIRHKTASLRGKVQTALKNEAYSIAVAYNIRVIIRFIYLVDLAPKFLPATTDQPVAAA